MNANASLGRRGEDAAAHYLNLIGWKVIDRNWRCRLGEIDIVAHDGRAPVVCEVKTRSGDQFGSPFEAITHEKAVRLRRLAWRWAAEHGVPGASVRVDVLCLLPAPPTDQSPASHQPPDRAVRPDRSSPPTARDIPPPEQSAPRVPASDQGVHTQNRNASPHGQRFPTPGGGVPAPRPPADTGAFRPDTIRSQHDRATSRRPTTTQPNASLPVVDGFKVEHIREVI